MDDELLYREWKERRQNVPVPQDFSRRVTTRLFSETERRRMRSSLGARSVAVRWAVSAGLALVGLLRLSLVTYNLLVP